ncbi:MAG TPA: acyltransferase family protein [Gammaproteobacteria bacterium]|nr:acyltransferase family protein [Gammaproteobacteria bacterium]
MQSVERLHALDAVRAYALLLGVVLHSAASFLENVPMPMWGNEPNATATVIYYVIHMFRMSAFFLIAGFFARLVVERRGVKTLVKDRGKRVAVPLLLFGPVVLIMFPVGLILGALPHGLDSVQALVQTLAQPPAPPEAGQPPTGSEGGILVHMWFLYYLLIFYAVALAIRALVHTVDPRRSIAAFCDRVVAFVMSGVWGPVLIALPIAAYVWQVESWPEWLGLPAPQALVPDPTALIGYGIPFALGWLLERQIPRLLDLQKSWLLYLVLALALTVYCLTTIGTTPLWQGPNLEGSERVFYTVAYMIGAWCWVFAFIGAAVRFLSDARPVTRYLADASYWIYLMHMTTILFFITLLRPYDWHWSIKFVIMIGGSMSILLVTYHYLVRFTWIGAILNGRRHPRPTQSPPADAAPIWRAL